MLAMGQPMSSEPLQRKVVVANPNGMHMRPWTIFVQTAGRFRCNVLVHYDGKSADGRSVLDLMMLAAERGSELTLQVEGPDAEQALEALAAIIATIPPDA